MSDFRQKLADPYRQQIASQAELRKQAEEVRHSCRAEAEAWPDLAEHTQKETLPVWDERQGRIDERMQPVDLRELYKAKRTLNALSRLSWKLPSALRIRGANFLYRLGIFSVRLVQLALILAVVFAILWVIWKLA